MGDKRAKKANQSSSRKDPRMDNYPASGVHTGTPVSADGTEMEDR